ncbi:tail fiber assembly protein [Xenorhabdus bovienii]|uniref:Putative tail fiber assembly protein n=2 Tax=Xenorhabdus bovienii TaxID=40576 RepID=A0A077NTH5_XENBV|nr:tail fiber assembly protein [Xenorhabdus bovienii]CDH01829.1 putative tail fiber assembly protein [Xenorhabdus bovienii str. feltiae Moldova]
MYVYCAKNNMFYPEVLKQDYLNVGKWPADGIAVDESVYLEFVANRPPEGKRRVVGENGLPAWGDIPPPTPEELQQRAERKKQYLMSQASNAIAPLQDAVELEMATGAEKSALTEWRKYRVLLNRVDCSTAPDVKWPEQPK